MISLCYLAMQFVIPSLVIHVHIMNRESEAPLCKRHSWLIKQACQFNNTHVLVYYLDSCETTLRAALLKLGEKVGKQQEQ